MGVGGHRHAGGKGQSTKKKKKRAPSICTPPLTVSFLHEAGSGPGQGEWLLGGDKRQEELWGWWPPARSTQPGPAGVRAEPAAPLPPGRSSDGSTLFPHEGQSMTGPELFPEAALCTFLGLVDKGGCAAPARSVLTVVEEDSTSGAGHTGRRAAWGPEQLPSAAPAVCRGGRV